MGRNRPRNKLGQFTSYRSIKEDAAGSSKVAKQPILVDTDSEDIDPVPQQHIRQGDSGGKRQSHNPSHFGKDPIKAESSPKFARFFPDGFYDDSDNIMEVSSDSLEYDYSSDDVEEMMDEMDKLFAKAQKKMINRANSDVAKNKEVITNIMDWLYYKVVDVKLKPRKKKGNKGVNKK